jgi:hypothetical protein
MLPSPEEIFVAEPETTLMSDSPVSSIEKSSAYKAENNH